MDCPKCVGKLQEVKIGKKEPLVVDRCFACGGLWFDKDELSRVVNEEITGTVEFKLEQDPLNDDKLIREIDLDKKEIVCPRCGGSEKMIKIPSARNKNVTVDSCKKCKGIWLDAGEYNKMSKRSPLEEKLENVVDFFRLHFPRIFKDSI